MVWFKSFCSVVDDRPVLLQIIYDKSIGKEMKKHA